MRLSGRARCWATLPAELLLPSMMLASSETSSLIQRCIDCDLSRVGSKSSSFSVLGKFQLTQCNFNLSRARKRQPGRPTAPMETCYGGAQQPDACWTREPHRIDVLLLYTAAALEEAGGTAEHMNLWIAANTAEADDSYSLSGVPMEIEVVHREQVPYQESGTVSEDRKALLLQCDDINDPNQELDQAHALRDLHKADVVVLITHKKKLEGMPASLDPSGTKGQAETLQNDQVGNYLFEPCAFAVIQVAQFESPELFLAHEIGHLLGAQHDVGSALGPGAMPASSFGFFDRTTTSSGGKTCGPMMTIMTSRSACDDGCDANGENCTVVCQREPYWSGIGHGPCDRPMGNQSANNRMTLARSALTVATYRCRTETPTNVWMKDAWDDTGAEPDPITAGLSVSDSPYIWVRNSLDTSVMFEREQHLHQDAIKGAENYLYVKVHNSGLAQVSGKLEILAAKSATAVSWPDSFEAVDS